MTKDVDKDECVKLLRDIHEYFRKSDEASITSTEYYGCLPIEFTKRLDEIFKDDGHKEGDE